MLKPITIVGGGLAGLTLGIGLRRQSVPVVLWEMGHYPRHRVCGEFISGRGQETLRRLDLFEPLIEAGARRAMTAAFFSPRQSFRAHLLPQPALCLSRFELDALLAEEFRKSGGELRCGVRWPGTSFDAGTVRANGRRVQADSDGWHWFGLKAHARKMVLQSDLELHLCANGYVGLCRLRDGKTNVCGLFRRRKGEVDLAQGVVPRLRGEVGSILYGRLEAAEFEEDSLTAIGGLMLRPRQATGSTECCIGDSLTMIPPVTGNGMSIAFESAELALAPLLAYARGESQWEATREAVAGRCDVSFRRRLGWARWFQHVLLCAPAQRHLLPWIFKWDACWQLLFWATR